MVACCAAACCGNDLRLGPRPPLPLPLRCPRGTSSVKSARRVARLLAFCPALCGGVEFVAVCPVHKGRALRDDKRVLHDEAKLVPGGASQACSIARQRNGKGPHIFCEPKPAGPAQKTGVAPVRQPLQAAAASVLWVATTRHAGTAPTNLPPSRKGHASFQVFAAGVRTGSKAAQAPRKRMGQSSCTSHGVDATGKRVACPAGAERRTHPGRPQ